MAEQDRRQTTKGIWMSKNKREGGDKEARGMADNILVMDVEGTDGRERGEDQDFERKSALFALATSEVLIVNIWEHQVGLYQGANMGLLKTVFEVNLQLFLKDSKYVLRAEPGLWAEGNGRGLHGLTPSFQDESTVAALLRHQRPPRHHTARQPPQHPPPRPLPHLVLPLQAARPRKLAHRRLL